MIAALSGWGYVTAFFAVGLSAVLLTIALFVVIDSWLHNRRRRRMQRETMEARQQCASHLLEIPKTRLQIPSNGQGSKSQEIRRARFLP